MMPLGDLNVVRWSVGGWALGAVRGAVVVGAEVVGGAVVDGGAVPAGTVTVLVFVPEPHPAKASPAITMVAKRFT
jgi:hypothetical protein